MINSRSIITILVVAIFSLSVILGERSYYANSSNNNLAMSAHCAGMSVAKNDTNKSSPMGCCHKGCVMSMCTSFISSQPNIVATSSVVTPLNYRIPESQILVSFITGAPFNPPKHIS